MKKYTKRLLAFLLATVMVVTGLPMSAKEVKAEGEAVEVPAVQTDITSVFTAMDRTTMEGPVPNTSTYNNYYPTQNAVYTSNWRIANTKTGLADGDVSTADRSSYWCYRKTGDSYQYFGIPNNSWTEFVVTAPIAGYYNFDISITTITSTCDGYVTVNGAYVGSLNTMKSYYGEKKQNAPMCGVYLNKGGKFYCH